MDETGNIPGPMIGTYYAGGMKSVNAPNMAA